MKLSSLATTIGKVLLSLLMITPILGTLGIFPPPTPEMYGSPEAFQFISLLMGSGYVMWMSTVVYLIALFCLWTKRTALAALLLLPITLNIVGFHAFLDTGLFTAGAIMGNVFLLLNLAFLWQQRAQYATLWKRQA
jgi:hypothetical protein